MPPGHYLVMDLEATCCDRGTIEREESEIIEIGAVMVDADTLVAVDEFSTFVRPVHHPVLTEFCTNLTSIRQEDVDTAPELREAIRKLVAWAEPFSDHLFCSWGDYDRNQIGRECRNKRIDRPFAAGHRNLKHKFSERLGTGRRFGMAAALQEVDLELKGTHHRGIDDARNIARLLPFIVGEGQPETPN